MATQPCYCHSHGTPLTVTAANDGRTIEIRNGVAVDPTTHRSLTRSDETAGWILNNCTLTVDEALNWSEWGAYICDRMASQSSHGVCGGWLRRHNRINDAMQEAE